MSTWAMMDIIDKTTNQGVPSDHPDVTLLKDLAFFFLTEQPIGKELNTYI